MAEKEYTQQQLDFLNALYDEDVKGDIRKAMDKAGYSRTTHVSWLVQCLNKEILDATTSILAMYGAKAAHGLGTVLDDPTALGAKNMIGAASQVLDRIGVVKKEQVQLEAKGASIFILPEKKTEED